MRLRTRVLAAIAVTVALCFPMVGATTTAAEPAKGTLTAPCEKAKQAKLNSGFMCDLIYVPKSKTKEMVAKIEAAPSMESVIIASAGDAGTCSFTGCYDWFSNTHIGYDAVGSYGWRYSNGAYQRIGTITIEIDDYLTSYQTTKIAPFCWSSTHSAWNVYHVVERYWSTASGSNGRLSPRVWLQSPTNTVTAARPKYCLPATGNFGSAGSSVGNTLTDRSVATGTIYHYITWRTAGFTGKWYAYAKAPIFYRPDCCSYLRFYSPLRYPYSTANAAWLPN